MVHLRPGVGKSGALRIPSATPSFNAPDVSRNTAFGMSSAANEPLNPDADRPESGRPSDDKASAKFSAHRLGSFDSLAGEIGRFLVALPKHHHRPDGEYQQKNGLFAFACDSVCQTPGIR